jgi:murein DD-endopeptidase MepM/ murein hydrolase activator NlpD
MRFTVYFLILGLITTSCYVSKNPLRKQIKLLQKGKATSDTSFVYQLPFNYNRLIVQGYFGKFSHKERAALDFKMRKGTKIYAARGGVVMRLKEDSDKGGGNPKYRQDGNHIVILHSDSTRGMYWHLKQNGALVNLGDTIKQGQLIGLSGSTGYSAFPHLHFMVAKVNNNNWQQIPTRFKTKKGIKYLRAWHWYKK